MLVCVKENNINVVKFIKIRLIKQDHHYPDNEILETMKPAPQELPVKEAGYSLLCLLST
jgi:hypothetical protein